MANMSGHIWEFFPVDAGGQQHRDASPPAFVQAFVFQNYDASTDRVLLKDARGRVVFDAHGDTDLTPVIYNFGPSIPVFGLVLEQLDSGQLNIHTE